MKKKTASIIGIVVGIAIIIIGICVMNPETLQIGKRNSLGLPIEFGADFYTEMYDVTLDVGSAVQRAYKNICNAIGWLIVVIGLFDIGYFLCKLASSEANGAGNTGDVKPTTATPTYVVPRHQVSTSAPAPRTTHSWRCDNCGKMATQSPCEHCGK